MQLQDLEVLKEIPGYPAILKAVLKTQIQMLVEQLSDQTGEESIILTASISDGTLCHLGSNRGKDFLDGRDDLKSQFLKHCLNSKLRRIEDNKRPYPEETDVNPRQAKGARYIAPHTSTLSEASQKKAAPSTSKKRKPATVASETPNVRVTPSPRDHSTPVSKETRSEVKNNSASVKLELPGDDLGGVRVTLNQNTDDETIDQTDQIEGSGRVKERSGHRLEVESTGESENNVTETFDSSEIKMEPMNQDELELEITGVEMGGDSTWSGCGLDYSSQQSEMPTEAGDASNQSGAYNQMMGQEAFDGSLLDSSHKESADDDGDVTSDNDVAAASNIGDGANTSSASVRTSSKQSIFLCDQCDYRAVLKRSLIRHQKHKHSNIYSHKCSICNMGFENQKAYNSHNTRAHSSLIVCLTCGKIFSRKSALNLHMKSHTGEYNFKCEICSKTFLHKNKFDVHVNKHMDIRPHHCTKCGKSFNHKSSCKRHIESCSKPRPPPELKCRLCQEVFTRADSLTAHIAAQHQNMRYFCFECGKAYRYRSSLDKHRKAQRHESWRS